MAEATRSGAAALAVRSGEKRWTAAEIAKLRGELEAEAAELRGEIAKAETEIAERMGDAVADVTLTSPSGGSRVLKLDQTEPGLWQSTVTADELGLWHATDGKLNALVNVGPANPREFAEVTSTTDVLAPIARATGGGKALPTCR